jgi:hypothetical protein
MILRAVLVVVVVVLVWHNVPERSNVMTQTNRDTLVLQVVVWE